MKRDVLTKKEEKEKTMTNLNRTTKCSLLALGLMAVLAGSAVADTVESELPLGPVDSDRDGIPDAVDNCPFRKNLEQFDADSDGLGDDCDVTLIATGSQQPGYLDITLPSFAKRKRINLGKLINSGSEPIPWHVSSQSDDFDRLPSGTLAPGKSVQILVSLDVTGLPHGVPNYEAVAIHYAMYNFPFDMFITVNEEPEPTYCEYTLSLLNVEVTSDQNTEGDGYWLGGKNLEIEVIEYVDLGDYNPSVDWPATNDSEPMKEGESTEFLDWVIYRDTVPAGQTVTQKMPIHVVEHDSGANGNDDEGEAEETIEFTCSGGPTTKDFSETVTLDSPGNGKGKVKVTTRAWWCEGEGCE